MFRALLCPSSGARNYNVDYHIGRFVLGLLYVGGQVRLGSFVVHCIGRHWVRSYTVNYTHVQRVRICCHNTDHVLVNGHDWNILVIFSQALYKAPLIMVPLWSETCWSTFKYSIILIVSTNYIFYISWIMKCSVRTVHFFSDRDW